MRDRPSADALRRQRGDACDGPDVRALGRGDDTVGNPHRARVVHFELFELIVLLKLYKQFPAEQFEATVSQSTLPYPPLRLLAVA